MLYRNAKLICDRICFMVRTIILFLIITSFAFSQHTIRGVVLDATTQQPLVGANIYIPDLKTGTTTDLLGNFLLKKIPQRTFFLHVSLIGFSSKVISVSSKDSAKLYEVALVPSETELQEVVVTGVSSGTELARNPVPTVLQGHDLLLQSASTNVIDRLSQIPGINFIGTGNGIAKPVIRGLSYNRVVVLRDGLRQEGQQWGDEHGIEIDDYDIDRVEIIKGPGSIMYGSDAMAGVINNLTPKFVEEGKQIAEVQTNYQSNANLFSSSLMQAGNIDGINWLGRVSQKKSGNYSNASDGKVLNSGFEEYNGSGYLGINREWGFSHLQFSTFNQKVGLVEGERDSLGQFLAQKSVNDTLAEEFSPRENELSGYDNSIGIPFQRINHNRIALLNSIFFGESKLSIDASFQQNRRREYANILSPDDIELHFLLTTWNLDVKYLFPEFDDWNFSTGFSTQYQTNANHGEEFLIPEYSLMDIGGFVFVQKDFDRLLLLSGGLRYDLRTLDSKALYLNSNEEPTDEANSAETKFGAFERTLSNLSASIGASYQWNDEITTRLNIASGFRSPNLAELGSNGKHEGTFRYEIGNPTLKPEQSLQFDLGATFNSEHVSIDIAGFYNGIANYIFLEKLNSTAGGDSLVDPTDPAVVFKFIQGEALLYGGELTIDIHPHPLDWLHFENSFSYVRGIQQHQPDSMKNLPFMPAPKFQSELRAQFNSYQSFRNLYFKIDGEYFFPQNHFYSAFGTETATKGYFLLSAGMGSEFTNANNRVICKLYLSANNLLDTKYQSHLSRLKYAPINPVSGEQGVFNQGRNFSARVVVPLEF